MSHPFIATNAIAEAHQSDIYAVTTTEKYTITGSGDGVITLWDNAQTEPGPLALKTFQQGIHHLAVNASGSILAAVGFDGHLHLFDLHELKPIEQEQMYKQSQDSWSVAFSTDLDYLVVSTIDGRLKLWDMNTFTLYKSFESNRKGFGICSDISSDGTMVAVGFEKGGLNVYSVSTGRLIYSVTSHTSTVRSVKFSPMGNFLAAAGDSKSISLYSTVSGEHVVDLSGHEGWIFALDWNASGEFILSTAYDGKCKIWSIETRAAVATQSESEAALLCGKWLNPGWGKGVIGGHNQGIVTVGIDRTVRWYREASGT